MKKLRPFLLYIGQQYIFYKRKLFLSDELIQIFGSKQAVEKEIKDAIKEELLVPIDDKVGITEKLIGWIGRMSPEVFRLGKMGGGDIRGYEERRIFTTVILFDTTVRFSGPEKIKYKDRDILFTFYPNHWYQAKAHCQKESQLRPCEETINRYLSHLSFHYRIPVVTRYANSGSIDMDCKVRLESRRQGIYLEMPKLKALTQRQARAVSFYRQYKNFASKYDENSPTDVRYYQLLSLVKIIEGVAPSSKQGEQKSNFVGVIDKYKKELSSENQAKIQGIETKYQKGAQRKTSFSEIVWEYYRHGVSHWRARGEFLDPDVPDEILATTLGILSLMIIPIIEKEFKIRQFSRT